MSRRNIADLPPPDPTYRVDLVTRRHDGQVSFETVSFAREVDLSRARSLRRAAVRYPGVLDAGHAQRLAAQLEQSGETGANPESPASSLYMRKQRLRVIGALWRLMEGSR
jgi:hypothetical protein